jgi:hypothetical protein
VTIVCTWTIRRDSNSNLLNPVGSQARDHQSTSDSAGSQPEWSSAWSNRPGRTRTRCSNLSPIPSPILELKLIGLESVDVVLVDVETEQVETRLASNLVAILLLRLS